MTDKEWKTLTKKTGWDKSAICFEDERRFGGIRIMKVDGDTDEPLDGAKFTLYLTTQGTSWARIISNYIGGDGVVHKVGEFK